MLVLARSWPFPRAFLPEHEPPHRPGLGPSGGSVTCVKISGPPWTHSGGVSGRVATRHESARQLGKAGVYSENYAK
jgi:hypothetical protein